MKKFKAYKYEDVYRGWGVGETVCFISANSKEHAKRILKEAYGKDANYDMGVSEMSAQAFLQEKKRIRKEIRRLKAIKTIVINVD